MTKTNHRVRRHIYLDQTVLALIHRAIDLGHKNLPGLLHLTRKDVIEKHKRRHTVPITPQHAKGATPGDACDCIIAHAAMELPEVYAALILRRITYMLEKDDRGRLKVFRYNSPDAARRTTLRFDKRLKTERVVVTFAPVPPSGYIEAQKKYNRRFYTGKTKKHANVTGPKFRASSFQRTMLPGRLLEPLSGGR